MIRRLLDFSPETFDLLVYLVASHHGKVRLALHAGPKDQEYRDQDGRGLPIRGVREGDRLPSVVVVPGEPPLPEVALTLLPSHIGLSERTGISWQERCAAIIERHGPGSLAFLETILRAGGCSRFATQNQRLDPGIGGRRMSIHLHLLKGCSPTPLANYLKALGILRLVGEQVDKQVRGWWDGEQFCVLTRLSREELERYFLEGYEPTPLLSPWNKGCGFFNSEDPGLDPIERSHATRFDRFRRGVKDARLLSDAISRADAAIRAVKARTKTNRAFQTKEQRALLVSSEAYLQCLGWYQSQTREARPATRQKSAPGSGGNNTSAHDIRCRETADESRSGPPQIQPGLQAPTGCLRGAYTRLSKRMNLFPTADAYGAVPMLNGCLRRSCSTNSGTLSGRPYWGRAATMAAWISPITSCSSLAFCSSWHQNQVALQAMRKNYLRIHSGWRLRTNSQAPRSASINLVQQAEPIVLRDSQAVIL